MVKRTKLFVVVFIFIDSYINLYTKIYRYSRYIDTQVKNNYIHMFPKYINLGKNKKPSVNIVSTGSFVNLTKCYLI